ncbi:MULTISPECIES: molecular chaperone DnaJ [unclassified Undibacterium]|uniref:molecular chaperone DnaJ n=2 Tax=unclassified Undibacterium TaxID=2630295 RepID=UPI002AC8B286|nr:MULTISPECIES: molecular chaperone DnaJ [unclassified Undibacterium]MEB0216973.1 molecular chaperone DnaJ [Undibacterium sp. 5I2]WPX45432.1 molecular chaperone DnaJ [Undibacterium sp. CCC3.4]
MKNLPHGIVHIGDKDQAALTKSQKLFNKLIKKIDSERKHLLEWQTMIPLLQQKFAKELQPHLHTLDALRIRLVKLFDQSHSSKGYTKKEKEKLSDIVSTVAVDLVANHDDEDLKKIYNKHSGADFDAESLEQEMAMKAAMEDLLGIDLGEDFDARSPEEMMAHLHEKMQEKITQQEQLEQAQSERQSKRKKSAKTLAKEAQQQEESQNISQSIREVYRKLASALHPDRELDSLERARKTALMQRVNVAYDAKDLLKLLELQLEVEQIDQASINSMSEQRLKYYNKILSEQSNELQQEVMALKYTLSMHIGLSPEMLRSPNTVLQLMDCDIEQAKRDISGLENDLVLFAESKAVKDFLKTYRVPDYSMYEDSPY